MEVPLGSARLTRQPFSALAPAVTVTLATKPPLHWFCTAYAAEQAEVPVLGEVLGVVLGEVLGVVLGEVLGVVLGEVLGLSVRFFCWTCHWVWHRPQLEPTKLAPAVVSPFRRH